MNEEQQILYQLGVALAIGLLIGIERGWKEREQEEGGRVAGVRTYGLIGLLGGVSAVLAARLGVLALAFALVGLAGVLATAYVATLNRGESDIGITSLVAGLLTFVLGALAGVGQIEAAGASAVVVTLLLAYKPLLHRWVGALEADELEAGIKLLLISIVMLPILPNEGFGPYQALNPYAIWWMVVLIATISFVGYFAVKIGGARRGAVFTGLFGGLASSTALTLHFSRLARADPALAPVLAVGVLLACGTMAPRVLLIATVLDPALLAPLIVPLAVMGGLVYLPALLYWRLLRDGEAEDAASPLKNPLELKSALAFGVLLVLVLLLGKALREAFGDAGVLALAAVSGVADADAITLSLARMSGEDVEPRVAAVGIVIAAAVNNLTKAGMASTIGGRAVGLRVGGPLLASSAGGILVSWLLWR